MIRRTATSLRNGRSLLRQLSVSVHNMSTTGVKPDIAVVGGGISGLVCASELSKHGYNVHVFDMGRHNPGGRMSTRKTVWRDMQFDHGCQMFKVKSSSVRPIVEGWEAQGAVARWGGKIGELDASTGVFKSAETCSNLDAAAAGFFDVLSPGDIYVGLPTMDAVCRHLAASKQLDGITLGAKVQRAMRNESGKWLLEGEVSMKMTQQSQRVGRPPHTPWNLGVFDGLVLTDAMVSRQGAPGYLSIQSGADLSPMMSRILEVGSSPLFSLMLAVDAQEPLFPFNAASISGSETIQWVAESTSKPGRERADSLQCWVAITTEKFAEDLLGPRGEGGALPPQTPEYLAAIAPRIWEAVLTTMQPVLKGRPLPEPVFMQAQRWGAAVPSAPLGEACLSDPRSKVVACGDFCLGAGVENSVLSALAATQELRGMFEG